MWSKTWKESKKPRKQRLYVYKAPAHVRGSFLSSHLSPELRKKHNMRSLRIRKGDKVKVMTGQFKGKTGKVELVDSKKLKVFVTGIELVKKDGAKIQFGIHPSNLMITELEIADKKRLGEKA